jgi:hypothetical protein
MEPEPINGETATTVPTLAFAGVTKYRCASCHTALTVDHRTTFAPPACPDCGGALLLVAATGDTVDAAIAAAAQALPERTEPVQPTIPGLRPMFDYAAACQSIMEKRAELKRAESTAWLIGEKYKALKKRVETLASELATLIDELDERAHDARYSAPEPEPEPAPVATEREA